MATIKIRKQDRASGTHIDLGINGSFKKLAVDQEIEVEDDVLETLKHSSILFDVVGGDGGVSSSSTAPLTDTATRDRPNVEPEGFEVTTATAALEPEAQYAAENAEGQGAGADGHDQLGGQIGGGAPEGDEQPEDGDDETVADLKARIAGIDDKAELQKALDDEKAGKNRSTAISAIEAKLAE